ncbi:MAG TPA: hypothetical protein VMM12_07485 [Longimicrobiales bacterium]|nr:hypothetical protein [Longimicrobiales bacterium]
MSAWGLATAAAIWTLILGSCAVFAWFLAEVFRLARRLPREEDDAGPRGPQ